MSATPQHSTDSDMAARFMALFDGLDRSHGRYEIAPGAKADDNRKIKGRAWTEMRGAALADFAAHLEGRVGIGICPIRSDNSCAFGAIDVDVYPLDLDALAGRIAALGLPLIACRTKSGGAHCYLFMTEPTPAELVRAKLQAWAAALGHPGVEVFPKQTRLASKNDEGNWINLPYQAGRRSTRYALKADGAAISPEEFLAAAEAAKVPPDRLADWHPKVSVIDGDADLWRGAPPCLRALALSGFGDWQNNGLFNIAVYLRKRHGEGWQDHVAAYNERFLSPPVPPKDAKSVTKSVGKKSYFYMCKQEPIKSVCDKDACRGCEFGIGAAADADPTGKIEELNQSHAAVWVGDTVSILRESEGPGGYPEYDFVTIGAFKAWHCNQTVMVGDHRKKLGDYWIDHPKRRQYEGITFAPGRHTPRHFNTWQGFAVDPIPGDWSRFRAHLLDNVCGGDADLYKWVFGWFAAIFQQPEKKMGTALVIRGKQGTGKTTVGKVFGSLLGCHYRLVSEPRYITGRFNSHMSSLLLLHADEAFWAGDHTAEGKLKDLITGDTHMVEYKGKEPVVMPNHVRLFVTGNQDWIVPAAFEERRFTVLDIGEARMKDTAYFAAIEEEMDNGGREALLHDLMHFDLSTVNLRQIPQTAALAEQKRKSFTVEQRWWADVLERGRLPWGTRCPYSCSKEMLVEDYIEHTRKRGGKARAIQTELGIFLKKMVPGLKPTKGSYRDRNGMEARGGIYEVPPLAECRAAFDEKVGDRTEWSEPTEWLDEPERPAHDGPPF